MSSSEGFRGKRLACSCYRARTHIMRLLSSHCRAERATQARHLIICKSIYDLNYTVHSTHTHIMIGGMAARQLRFHYADPVAAARRYFYGNKHIFFANTYAIHALAPISGDCVCTCLHSMFVLLSMSLNIEWEPQAIYSTCYCYARKSSSIDPNSFRLTTIGRIE